jgi:hypothetical protein
MYTLFIQVQVARPSATPSQLHRWQDLWILGVDRARVYFDWLRTPVANAHSLTDLIFRFEAIHRNTLMLLP